MESREDKADDAAKIPISTETSQAYATSTEFCRAFADNINADTFIDDPPPAGEVLAGGILDTRGNVAFMPLGAR
jgi:hypothetical protein